LKKSGPRAIDLALQGGGAHGAFTWGVLDRLLADDRIVLDGISGTSAGAMNAVVLADGYARGGGPDGAREALHNFWKGVSDAARFSPLQRTLLDRMMGRWTLDNAPAYRFWRSLGFEPVRRVEPATFKRKLHVRYELARRLECVSADR